MFSKFFRLLLQFFAIIFCTEDTIYVLTGYLLDRFDSLRSHQMLE